jgi:hypothetical protein
MTVTNRNNTRAAKLKPMDVLNIRQMYADGWTQSRLSRTYGISIGQIGRIVRGESWQQFTTIRTEHDKSFDAVEDTMDTGPPPSDATIQRSLDRLKSLTGDTKVELDEFIKQETHE